MATVKVTVTLPDEQVQAVRVAVAAGTAANVSAFIQHAVSLALDDVTLWRGQLAEALEQTGGALTQAERDWADGILVPREAGDHAA